MLTFKYKRASDKELGHTEVYFNNDYIGYFLPNKSKAAAIDENWNFVAEANKVQYFYAKTRKELVDTLVRLVNKEPVKLKQHGGVVREA